MIDLIYFSIFCFVASFGRSTKDKWKLPRFMHWRKRFWIQGIHFPSCHSKFHVPSRWFHQSQWHWWQIYLWQQVRRWELFIEAHRSRRFVNGKQKNHSKIFHWQFIIQINYLYFYSFISFTGQCWTKHKRLSILHYNR